MAALIGDDHPRGQVLLERGEGLEGLIGEAVAFHKLDARFGLAFGPGPVRRARARLHIPVAAEGQIRGLKRDRAGRAIAAEDQRPRIVAE